MHDVTFEVIDGTVPHSSNRRPQRWYVGDIISVKESGASYTARILDRATGKAVNRRMSPLMYKAYKQIKARKNPIRVEDIKSVMLWYSMVALIKLMTGRVVYVPRETAEAFDASSGSYLERKVDQPWRDRTLHDIPLDEIYKVIRISKKSARVMTRSLFMVLVSPELARQFNEQQASPEAHLKALARLGIKVSVDESIKERFPKRRHRKRVPGSVRDLRERRRNGDDV